MHYNFYADKADKIEILEFIFKETDLHIYDHGSAYGQEIAEYKSINELTDKFDFVRGNKFSLAFQLWSPRHKGQVIFRKVELNPKYCNGHTYRYATDGWGLIQLYFGGQEDNYLNQSHIGHFNEKGAIARESETSVNGNVNQWDWKEIQKTSRRLKYEIHNRRSVRKMGSLGILKGADNLEKQGFLLR